MQRDKNGPVFGHLVTATILSGFVLTSVACDYLPGGALRCRIDDHCFTGDVCGTDGYCASRSDDGGLPREPEGPAPDGGIEPEGPLPDGGVEPESPQPDAGPVDGGNGDGGARVDGGNVDGGNVDGGNVDGGNVDGGNVDGGNVDGGNLDGGNTDAGPLLDAGVDAGPLDPLNDGGYNFPFEVTTFDVNQLVNLALQPMDLNSETCTEATFTFSTADETWTSNNGDAACVSLVERLNTVPIVDTGSGFPNASDILVATRWLIPAGITLRFEGNEAVILFAARNFELDGTLDVSGFSTDAGSLTSVTNGAKGNRNAACRGGFGNDSGNEGGGGGGGGHAVDGARGGHGRDGPASRAGGVGGPALNVLMPTLAGGCVGGRGAGGSGNGAEAGAGGAAGGAIQLVVGQRLFGTGLINASGGSGSAGTLIRTAGGGGGSAGTVWIAASALEFETGRVIANGGPGSGAWGREANEASQPGAPAAHGRASTGGAGGDAVRSEFGTDEGFTANPIDEDGARGGAGGWRQPPTRGAAGVAGTRNSGGGGGGSQGMIWVEGHDICRAPLASPAVNAIDGACNNLQRPPICGDGVVELPEECDNGINNLGDLTGCGCNSDCTNGVTCSSSAPLVATDGGTLTLGTGSGASSKEHAICDGCSTVDGVANDWGQVRVECERTNNCNVSCNSVAQGCDVICRVGSTCTLGCDSVGGLCQLFCEDNANCRISSCTSVGNGDRNQCTVRAISTIVPDPAPIP